MASAHVFVLDSALKRTQVKVPPGKYLREVLEEACKARKWDPESYMLKTQSNKVVDLSQPYRLSGLSGGAKLQLVQASRSPSVVSVALLLPDSEGGERLNDRFPSTTSLWLLLRQFEDAVAGQPPRKLNLTQRGTAPDITSGAGRLEYEQPVLNLMGRNLDTFADLQKTLGQLGINGGTVMIRLNFKNSGQPLEEAMQTIGQYFKGAGSEPVGTASSAATGSVAGAHAAADGTMDSLPNADAENSAVPLEGAAGPEPAEPEDEMPAESAPIQLVENDVIASSSITEPQPTSKNPSPRDPSAQGNPHPSPRSNTLNGISVYRPPSSDIPAAARQPDDPTIFEPSIDHAKAHQAALARASRNRRLPSDKELTDAEADRQAQLALVQSVTLRVRYPDQSSIETEIGAEDTSADLYAKVMGTLAYAPEPFELRYLDAKATQKILPPTSNARLVRDFGFRGKVLVIMVWGEGASADARAGPSLKEEYRSRARELRVELQTQQDRGREAHEAAMAKPEGKGEGSGKGRGDVEAKMKKFLGFGKK